MDNAKDAIVYQQSPFIYWEDTRGAAMNLFIGILTGLTLIYLSLFFLINGFRSSDKYVKSRSFLVGSGLAVFIIGVVINFVFGASNSPYKYIGTVISTCVGVLSCIMIFIGVRKKNKFLDESTEVQ